MTTPKATLNVSSSEPIGSGVEAIREEMSAREVLAVAGSALLAARLLIPPQANGLVLVTNSCGHAHTDAHTVALTKALYRAGWASLCVDLLTAAEARDDVRAGSLRNDMPILARRIEGITDWLMSQPEVGRLPLVYLGMGAAASEAMFVAARARPGDVRALAVYAARPDLVADQVRATTTPLLVLLDDTEQQALEPRIRDTLRAAEGPTAVEEVRDGEAAGRHHVRHGAGEVDWATMVAPQAIEWFSRFMPQ